jgi:hypothetical protein
VGRLSIFRRSPSLSAALAGRHAAGHRPVSVTLKEAALQHDAHCPVVVVPSER